MKRILVSSALIGLLAWACSNTCSSGSVCGDGNIVGPGPALSPSATATPGPSPSPTAGAVACPLGPSVSTSCAATTIKLSELVSKAQGTLTAGSSEAAYVASLVLALRAAGVCATSGPPLASDEVAVKISNSYSETYDVWNAANFPQTLYQSTCTPARF